MKKKSNIEIFKTCYEIKPSGDVELSELHVLVPGSSEVYKAFFRDRKADKPSTRTGFSMKYVGSVSLMEEFSLPYSKIFDESLANQEGIIIEE
jgi:hypothetical protein